VVDPESENRTRFEERPVRRVLIVSISLSMSEMLAFTTEEPVNFAPNVSPKDPRQFVAQKALKYELTRYRSGSHPVFRGEYRAPRRHCGPFRWENPPESRCLPPITSTFHTLTGDQTNETGPCT
jgi:hypothetical protein